MLESLKILALNLMRKSFSVAMGSQQTLYMFHTFDHAFIESVLTVLSLGL